MDTLWPLVGHRDQEVTLFVSSNQSSDRLPAGLKWRIREHDFSVREPEDLCGLAFPMLAFRTISHFYSAGRHQPIHQQRISLRTPWTVRLLRQTRSAGMSWPQNRRSGPFGARGGLLLPESQFLESLDSAPSRRRFIHRWSPPGPSREQNAPNPVRVIIGDNEVHPGSDQLRT